MKNRKRKNLEKRLNEYETELLGLNVLIEVTSGLLDKTKGPTLTTAKKNALLEALEQGNRGANLCADEIAKIKDQLNDNN